jgi:hypothetical protein
MWDGAVLRKGEIRVCHFCVELMMVLFCGWVPFRLGVCLLLFAFIRGVVQSVFLESAG